MRMCMDAPNDPPGPKEERKQAKHAKSSAVQCSAVRTHPHGLLDGGEEVLGPHGEGLLLPEVKVLGVVVHQLGLPCC